MPIHHLAPEYPKLFFLKQAAFHYFAGRIHVYKDEYMQAADELKSALDICPRQSKRNIRLVGWMRWHLCISLLLHDSWPWKASMKA